MAKKGQSGKTSEVLTAVVIACVVSLAIGFIFGSQFGQSLIAGCGF